MLSLLSYRCVSRYSSKSLVLLSSLKPGLRSIKTEGKVNSGEYEPLLDIIARRREEAGRSVMVQVKGKQSAQDLYTYCSTAIGHVKGLHFYKNQSTKAFSNFYIVEFEDEICVAKILRTGSHSGADSGTQPVPVTSPFLWFSGAGAVQPDLTVSPPVIQPLPVFNDVRDTPDEKEPGGTISDQIYNLWKSQEITESNLRARFMVCRQVELTMKGMFSHAAVLPFGSSVNGFGQSLGDQDMILSLDPLQDKGRESRLVFHSKSCVSGDRAQTRRYCDQISSILQIFLPGCQDVQKILFARVPIIKYRHELTGFDCDLSMTSSSGLYMSCLLHIWGGADWRVHGMVPTVQKLIELGSSQDQFSCEDGVSVNFLHNINPHLTRLNQCYHSDMTLFELLRGFFEFYSHFEFNKHALNPISGETEEKNKLWPKTSALDILNPLEPDLNVSYNVNLAAVKMFKDRCTESRKRCDKMSEQGDNLATLFGKEKDPAVLAMPKMFEVGLGKGRAGDNKLSNTPGRTNLKSKSREISLNLDSIFSETDSRGDIPLSPATQEQKRLDKEKSIRSTKHVPVFKQHF